MSDEAQAGQPPQGWYPDPNDPNRLRWWDGTAWTEHTHPGQPAAAEKAEKGAIAQWLSVRSNQALLAVLIIAILLFAYVMLIYPE